MLCCWCLSRKSQGSFWGISAPLSTGSRGKVLIDQSLEDTGNAQHLRKTRNKSNKSQKKHMHQNMTLLHTLRCSERWTIQAFTGY